MLDENWNPRRLPYVTSTVKKKVWNYVRKTWVTVWQNVKKPVWIKVLEWQTCVSVKQYSCFTSTTYGGYCNPYA